MAPYSSSKDVLLLDHDELSPDIPATVKPESAASRPSARVHIKWFNVSWMILLHMLACYGLYRVPFANPLTWLWTVVIYVLGAWGITAGAHRLWTHRSYRAKLPLRIFLAVCNSLAFQNDIIDWSRDHRAHHKFSETDADPHNAKRGFFFSHCGWLMVKKHPDVKAKGNTLDYSDLYADPVCIYQKKVYYPSVLLMCIVVPTVVPIYFWGESFVNGFFICAFLRYLSLLHSTWCVNSVAHMFGNKPYDKDINPVENLYVAVAAVGEGYHNYHHTFPSDYSTSEHGWTFNLTTLFIDFMARLGQVEDRKRMTYKAVQARKERTGDGTVGFGYGQSKRD